MADDDGDGRATDRRPLGDQTSDAGATAGGMPGAAPGGGALESSRSLTRRAALAAALGGLAAIAAQAAGLVGPEPAAAWDLNPLTVGMTNEASMTTELDCWTDRTALQAESATGDGLVGISNGDRRSGVYGLTLNRQGYGVFGRHIDSHATGALATSSDGVQGWVDKPDVAGVRGTAELVASAGVIGENVGAHTAGRLGGDAGVRAWVDESASEADALSVEGPVRFSRAGVMGIRAGETVGSKPVAHLHASTRVFAMLQTTTDVQVASAGIDASMENVGIRLSGPAPVGVTVAFWLVEIAS